MTAAGVMVAQRAVAASLPMVIDADGLRLVLEQPDLVAGSSWTVLTPNKPEYARLLSAFGDGKDNGGGGGGGSAASASSDAEQLKTLARALRGPAIVRKGATDLISDGHVCLENTEPGCLKRCGGQGDVLAGSIATLLGWARAAGGRLDDENGPPAQLLAAYTGCYLTRRFAKVAFARHRRAMTAPDLIEAIGPVFEEFSPAE